MEAIVNICMFGSYILTVLCLGAWLFFIGRKLVLEPKSMQNMIIMFVSVFVLYFLGKLGAPEMNSHLSDTFISNNNLTSSIYSTVNGLYFASIFGLIVTFAVMLGGIIWYFTKK